MAQQLPVSEEDFVQPGMLWEVLGRQPGQQDNFVGNVARHLSGAKEGVRRRTYDMFRKIDGELGRRIKVETEKLAPHPQSQAKGSAEPRFKVEASQGMGIKV